MAEEFRDNHRTLTERFFLIRDDLDTGIAVFKYDNKTYYLVPTWHLLHHDDDEDPGGDVFTIISDPASDPNLDHVVRDYKTWNITGADLIDRIAPERARVFSMPLSPAGSKDASAAERIPCVFVALGWLSEHEAGKGWNVGDPSTYYVILLNLSTDPISVWLLYDYHMLEELDSTVRSTNRNDGDGTRLFIDGDIGSILASNSVGYLDRYKDFRKHYTNEEDMCPKANPSQTTTPDHKNTHRPLVDEESPSNRSQISSSSRESTDRDSESSREVETPATTSVADDDEIAGTTPSTKHRDTCCSGSDRPFDLAMLAPDVDKWDLDNGMDLEEVQVCLHATSMRLGSSLRVRAATQEELDRLSATNQRVNLRALCSG